MHIYVLLTSGQNTYVNLIFFCMGDFPLFFHFFSMIYSSMCAWSFILEIIDHCYFFCLTWSNNELGISFSAMPLWVWTGWVLPLSHWDLVSSYFLPSPNVNHISQHCFLWLQEIYQDLVSKVSLGVSFRPSQLTEKEMCVYSNSRVCTYL